MKLIFSLGILFIFLSGGAQEKSKLIVDFELVNYKKGKLYVAIYNSKESFLKEAITGTIVKINNGKATAIFENLKYGTYAVSSFYDKNENGKLDTNFIGIPKEPTGISNNPKPRMGPPRFKDAKFIFSSTNNKIKINF